MKPLLHFYLRVWWVYRDAPLREFSSVGRCSRAALLSIVLLLCLLFLAACGGDNDEPLPTIIDQDEAATESSQNHTATIEIQQTLVTLEPSRTPFPTHTFTPTATFTPSPTSTNTPSATIFTTPTRTPIATGTPASTETPITPSPSPTHILNPDAVVKPTGAELLSAPSFEAFSGLILPHLTSLQVQARTADNQFLQVSQIDSNQQGWVAASDVVIYIPLDRITISTSGITAGGGDLNVPPGVTAENVGRGFPYAAYNYTTCGDNYWRGDGTTFSMETFTYEGRYPRFAETVIRVYVYYSEGVQSETWERAVAETLAQLSQAVRIERVFVDDLNFFQPAVPMETLLAETRVDMVWHILAPGDFDAAKTCESARSCSQYAFDGQVTGGPLRFSGIVFVPDNTERKAPVLLHAAVHALGLWVHSPDPVDLMYANSTSTTLSPRDVLTLRCLYNAPPYGDAVFPD